MRDRLDSLLPEWAKWLLDWIGRGLLAKAIVATMPALAVTIFLFLRHIPDWVVLIAGLATFVLGIIIIRLIPRPNWVGSLYQPDAVAWEGESTRPDPSSGGVLWTFPPVKVTIGNPSSDEVTVLPQTDELRWVWFRITNTSQPTEMQAELVWHETGQREHEYLAPWREGNVATLFMANGRTSYINVAELLERSDQKAHIRVYSTANLNGYFNVTMTIPSQVYCRLSILRGEQDPIHMGDYVLGITEKDLRFTRLPKSRPAK